MTTKKHFLHDLPEQLIPQREARRIMGGQSDMTFWRWRKSGLLPEPIVINRRNFYRAADIADMQRRLTLSCVDGDASEYGGDGDES